jgi:hypothetical protein
MNVNGARFRHTENPAPTPLKPLQEYASLVTRTAGRRKKEP